MDKYFFIYLRMLALTQSGRQITSSFNAIKQAIIGME